MPLSELTQIKLLLEAMALSQAQGNIGKQTANVSFLAITTGSPKDSVSLAALAGKKLIALAGIVASNDTVTVVSSAPGYSLTSGDEMDTLFVNGASIGLINVLGFFNANFAMVGAGTSAEWNTGHYSSVFAVYINENTVAPSTTSMITFTTADAVDTYTDSALVGVTPGVVIYGQSILAPSQYTKVVGSDTITIDPGLPVEADLQLIIIPQ